METNTTPENTSLLDQIIANDIIACHTDTVHWDGGYQSVREHHGQVSVGMYETEKLMM